MTKLQKVQKQVLLTKKIHEYLNIIIYIYCLLLILKGYIEINNGIIARKDVILIITVDVN